MTGVVLWLVSSFECSHGRTVLHIVCSRCVLRSMCVQSTHIAGRREQQVAAEEGSKAAGGAVHVSLELLILRHAVAVLQLLVLLLPRWCSTEIVRQGLLCRMAAAHMLLHRLL
jgi:hypothetical protein